jgi:hypothetical protein
MNLAEQVKEKITALESALLSSHPTMPTLLREIHKILKDDPEVVTLLSEPDIAIIVSGLKRQTNTEITTSLLKTKTKSLKNVSVDDMF